MRNRPRSLPRQYLLPLLLAALVVLTFANALRGGFVLDDHLMIENNPNARWPDGLRIAFTTDVGGFTGRPTPNSYYRPLVMASFVVDRALWGLNAGPFHAQNVLWHALSCVLAYLLIRRMSGSSWAAGWAAALWAVHPLVSESVAWISGRTDPMAACGILGALLAFLAYRDSGSARWLVLAAALTWLGCLAKEPAVLTPLLALIAARAPGPVRAPGGGASATAPAVTRRAWIGVAALWVPVLVYLAMRTAVTGSWARTGGFEDGRAAAMRIALRALAFYARTLLWPDALVGDIHVTAPRWDDPAVIAGALLAAGGVALLAIVWRRRSPAAPMLAIGALLLGFTSGIVLPLVIPVAVRYLYLPSLWLWAAVLVALAGAGGAPRRTWLRFAPGPVLAVLAVLAIVRNADYRDDGHFYPTVVRNAAAAGFGVEPGYYAIGNYGHLLATEGRLAEAERLTRQAINQKPAVSLAWTNLGNILQMKGDTEGALAAWRRSLALDPGAVDPLVNTALTLDRAGRHDEALAAYRVALARPLDAPRRAAIEARVRELERGGGAVRP